MAERRGRVLGVRLPPQEDDERESWSLPPSRRPALPPIAGALPQAIELQENGDFVLRFLTEDVGKDLDRTLDAILRALGPAVVI